MSLKVNGEGSTVTPEQYQELKNMQIQIILENFANRDIFNADECGLFWSMIPERTLALGGEKCIGVKSSKERITVLLCTNNEGNKKLPICFIGKSKFPPMF